MEREPLLSNGGKATDLYTSERIYPEIAFSADQNGYTATPGDGHISSDENSVHITIDQRPRKSLAHVKRLTLSWRDITVTVPGKNRGLFTPHSTPSKEILKKVSGYVEPGSLIAVMGASGAGKSTLLNVLTNRNRGNLIVDGDVMINALPVGDSMTKLSAYIQQEDLFFTFLKVREHLTFQSLLRMDKETPKEERKLCVEEVMQELGLTKTSETMIGDPNRGIKGISGGERKRLAFASELLTNPSLIFCDEATSGLDSYMAQSVIQTLQQLANQGRTILCTIHQPSSDIYALFNQVLFMAEGSVAYLGQCSDALSYFSRLGYQCPKNYNPADFFIHTLAIIPSREKECREKVKHICAEYENSEQSEKVRAKLEELPEQNEGIYISLIAGDSSPYKASWTAQFRAVLWRTLVNYLREPLIIKMKTIQVIFIALLYGLVFLDQNYHTNSSAIQNINGFLFLFIIFMSFTNMFGVLQVFPLELPVFLREHFNGMYRTDIYFLSKSLIELPYQFIILPILFISITYWMVGLYPHATNFAICCGIAVLISNVASSLGYLISAATGNLSLALVIAPPLFIPLLIFGGLFLNADDVPIYFIWVEYISWFKYAYEVLVINEWDSVKIIESCSLKINETIVCPTSGQEVIKSLSFNKDNVLVDVYAMLALMVGFRILAYIALLCRTWRKK